MTDKYAGESTHWYDHEGTPQHTYIAKTGKYKGQERPTTLRQARKHNFVPSVTGIIAVAANPALENWKSQQLLLSALTLPRGKFETADDFMGRVKVDSGKHAKEAAEVGSLIHADIERGFNHERMGKYAKSFFAVTEILDEHFPNEEWISEGSFCCRSGYGGSIDLHSKNGIFIDFKTKENIKGKKPKDMVFDSHGMQLSAYSFGVGRISPVTRANIFIDRDDPSYACIHLWDKESHYRHLTMFQSLLQYWQLSKKYKPEFKDDCDDDIH